MWNQKTKSIKNIPDKKEGINLIGFEVGGKIITNIEWNGQIRVLEKEKATPDMVERWRKDYLHAGLKFHEGHLLNEHDSQELYEKIEELDA